MVLRSKIFFFRGVGECCVMAELPFEDLREWNGQTRNQWAMREGLIVFGAVDWVGGL